MGTWEPLVVERQREKCGKYSELATNLATQWPGWSVEVVHVPVGVGSLGVIRYLREKFMKLGFFSRRRILRLVRNIEFEALCSGVRILRRHLSS